ncbi:uncharacterized protein METZ01_LOCUS242814, partial [marine metagenome]
MEVGSRRRAEISRRTELEDPGEILWRQDALVSQPLPYQGCREAVVPEFGTSDFLNALAPPDD